MHPQGGLQAMYITNDLPLLISDATYSTDVGMCIIFNA